MKFSVDRELELAGARISSELPYHPNEIVRYSYLRRRWDYCTKPTNSSRAKKCESRSAMRNDKLNASHIRWYLNYK